MKLHEAAVLALCFSALYLCAFPLSLLSAELLCFSLLFAVFLHFALLKPHIGDFGDERRRILGDQFVEEEFKNPKIRHSHEFLMNSAHQLIFTRLWEAEDPARPPKAIVLFLHGYTATSGTFTHEYAGRLVEAGYAVGALDHVGHGRSDGLSAFIPDFDRFVVDAHLYAGKLKEKFPGLKIFSFSESMGGAISLRLALNYPTFYAGHILMAPMCKVSDTMKPHKLVVSTLIAIAHIVPKWPIVPTPNLLNRAFKRADKRTVVSRLLGEARYWRKPRLGTALTLLRVTEDIEKNFHRINSPLLVLHGAADLVTDPKCSEALVEKAAAKDKSLKLYPGAWHVLLAGEYEETVNAVYSDIIQWLDKRC